MQELRQLAALIKDQATLDYCLLEVDDVFERRAMFNAIEYLLPFNAVFPSPLNLPALETPGAPELIVNP
jgi:hypothetical protein